MQNQNIEPLLNIVTMQMYALQAQDIASAYF